MQEANEFPGPAQWHSGTHGTLSPWSLAQVWALSKVSDDFGLELSHTDIATLVTKVGGGNPSQQCISGWRTVFATDPNWYPGKAMEGQKTPGRRAIITEKQKAQIAKSAMMIKAKGGF